MWKVFLSVMRFAFIFFSSKVGKRCWTCAWHSHKTITYNHLFWESDCFFSHICPFNSTCPHWFLWPTKSMDGLAVLFQPGVSIEAFYQQKSFQSWNFPCVFFSHPFNKELKKTRAKNHPNIRIQSHIYVLVLDDPKLLSHKPPPPPKKKNNSATTWFFFPSLPYLLTPCWTPRSHIVFLPTRQTDDLVPLVTEALALAFQVDSSRLRNVAPWRREGVLGGGGLPGTTGDIWMFPKIVGFTPKSSILYNRVFHYFHHPFWGFPPIFGTPIWSHMVNNHGDL